MVGVARLELAASWSQTKCPTNWATPRTIEPYTQKDHIYIINIFFILSIGKANFFNKLRNFYVIYVKHKKQNGIVLL